MYDKCNMLLQLGNIKETTVEYSKDKTQCDNAYWIPEISSSKNDLTYQIRISKQKDLQHSPKEKTGSSSLSAPSTF